MIATITSVTMKPISRFEEQHSSDILNWRERPLLTVTSRPMNSETYKTKWYSTDIQLIFARSSDTWTSHWEKTVTDAPATPITLNEGTLKHGNRRTLEAICSTKISDRFRILLPSTFSNLSSRCDTQNLLFAMMSCEVRLRSSDMMRFKVRFPCEVGDVSISIRQQVLYSQLQPRTNRQTYITLTPVGLQVEYFKT